MTLSFSLRLFASLFDTHRIYHSGATSVITQGRNDSPQWVSSYKVAHSLDGSVWEYVRNDRNVALTYQANTDQNTRVENELPTALITRYLRLYPITYYDHPSMRVEVMGCLVTGQNYKLITHT